MNNNSYRYFIFSDGTSSLSQNAAIFAQVELHMSTVQISIALVEASVCGVFGALFFVWTEKRKICTAHTMLFLNLLVMAIIPIWGQVALTTISEFYICVAIFSTALGAQSAASRSIYGVMIPGTCALMK